MITPSRIARFVGLVGLTAFLALAARTTTATQSFAEDETPPPPPIIGRASLFDGPRPVLASRVDESPLAIDEPEPSPADPPIAPDAIIPPHQPAADDLPLITDLPSLSPSPADGSKDNAKSKVEEKKGNEPAKAPKLAKDEAPEVVPAPLAPSEADAPPIAPDLTGDDFPSINPAIEPLSIDPAKASQIAIDDPDDHLDPLPAPTPIDRARAWKAQSGNGPQPAGARGVAVDVVDAPVIASSDPDAQARSFVERNQREAEARLQALESEAEELRGRLTKIEAAIQQWRSLADAMRKAQEPADAKPEAPEVEARAEAPQPQAATNLEAIPTPPQQTAFGAEPRSARAQDVPAPPLR